MYGKAFYEDVADALTGFLPPSLRDFSSYRSNSNVKVWFPPMTQEHYEVQLLKHEKRIVLEIGFHAEHKTPERNDETLQKLVVLERAWRKSLGAEPEPGPFIGYQSKTWRRISEMWDVNDDPELAVDAAERLAAYIKTLEPILAKVRQGSEKTA